MTEKALDWVKPMLRSLPKLLLVDDQPVNIQTLYQIFADDHEVFMATSGEQALALCRDKQPDLVLLDVIMPGMDGLETCQRLKEDADTADIPVIFVTSQNSPEEETHGLEVGAVDFISKPVNPAVVRARVKTQLTLKAQTDALRMLASLDGLTGVPNRRIFDERLDAEWRACRRSGSPLSLLMVDVDHFKLYNDHYGHLDGDQCLKAIASALASSVERGRDMLARFGGEEFVCLLPDTDLEGAKHIAEKLRQAVEGLAIPHVESKTAATVTVSLGVATTAECDALEPPDLLKIADEQLYLAKQSGRNRVCGVQFPLAQQAES
ncbi:MULTISPECIES: diguanylate cyclase [Spongiibacter]|jgi:diguanylate cyclase (GGDEF)-like protein|uniref:diguanylate cyclase n=1 Tax=Spongiibacter TaxID=630749 RepID=UPI0019601A3A|nr:MULTISPECIES: PleD family two-component system response regulator [Spongiibacter]MBM7422466.1 diguanylate cyclase (GGDEF)-like protein [Spongiibacter marinus]|tara:strand:- start:18815 stop:19780 length:966 start_codon:yes stop_codon:yes gene_type:complete